MDRARAARAIEDFLGALGVQSPELAGTPERVADAWIEELLEGYRVDVRDLLQRNVIACEPSRDVVVVRDVTLTTMCPHHLMPGTGFATIAFEPDRKMLGVGAVARAAHALARRLALQETIGKELAGALMDATQARWVACRLVLSHTCMTARGERAHGARLETLSVVGAGERASIERSVGLGT